MNVSSHWPHQWLNHIVVVYGYVRHILEHYHVMPVDMIHHVGLIHSLLYWVLS